MFFEISENKKPFENYPLYGTLPNLVNGIFAVKSGIKVPVHVKENLVFIPSCSPMIWRTDNVITCDDFISYKNDMLLSAKSSGYFVLWLQSELWLLSIGVRFPNVSTDAV